MDKSPDAFRTISEVADVLETPAHVLRFWESRFPQIKPVKRAGGRRYYRPSDVALLAGIKRLLHDEGLTIRGVQKILRDQGVRHVAGLSDDSVPLTDLVADVDIDRDLALAIAEDDTPEVALEAEIIPEAGFIAVEDEDEDEVAPAVPVQAVLPLFDTPRPAPDAPPAAKAPVAPPAPARRQPTLRTDASFASLIRALPPKALSRSNADVAALARRLAALRARMASRAEGSPD